MLPNETAVDVSTQNQPMARSEDRMREVLGEVNTSSSWQVRIDWHHEPPVVHPSFTWDRQASQQKAEHIARAALGWPEDPQLHVVAASVRGPGQAAWQTVSAPRVSAP